MLVDLVTGRYYTLEGSGDRVWDLCDGDHSVADIVSTLSAAHSVDEGMVRQDVVELFRRLSAEGLIDDVR